MSDAEVSERSQVHRDATETSYKLVRQRIIEGRYPPGTALLETALSTEYGVSRTPMREALNRLVQDDLIERSTRGYRVRVYTPEEIVDVYEARIALEVACAGLAAVRRTEFDLARLIHLHEERRGAADGNAAALLNKGWHDAVSAAAHNVTIVGMLTRLEPLLAIQRATRGPRLPAEQVSEHEAVTAALRDRDAVAAREAMREHLERVRDRWIADLVAEETSPASESL